jgi:hypothetical protein
VGCGSLFAEVHRIVAGAQLAENRRQLDLDERSILTAWRDGRHVDALTRWQDKGRLVATETVQESVTAMVRQWLAQREGAPDPHTQMRGLVMLAATNEQVDRINLAVQAVRKAAGELGQGFGYRAAAGHTLTLHQGDHVLLRINDRRQRMHDGSGVLNGYRGLVEAIDQTGHLHVAWQHDADPGRSDAGVHRARLSPEFIARGGVQLGYAMTVHKAEGVTVEGSWDRPDGTQQRGSVLVHAAGADEAGLYVAMSRHRDQAVLFAAREQVESEQTSYVEGTPTDARDRSRRVVAALAQRARATRENLNDVPAVRDTGRRHEPAGREPAPAPLERQADPRAGHHDAQDPAPAPGTPSGPAADREVSKMQLSRSQRVRQARATTQAQQTAPGNALGKRARERAREHDRQDRDRGLDR